MERLHRFAGTNSAGLESPVWSCVACLVPGEPVVGQAKRERESARNPLQLMRRGMGHGMRTLLPMAAILVTIAAAMIAVYLMPRG